MFRAIKKFIKLFFTVDTVRIRRSKLQIHTFDLVSQLPDPRPSEVQLVYEIKENEIETVPILEYYKTGKYLATLDNCRVYPNESVSRLLYKIADRSIIPYKLITESSPEELKRLADRMTRAYNLDPPVLGLFNDPTIGHLMFIASKEGNAESGSCIVVDLHKASNYGFGYDGNYAGVVRTKDIINKQVVRAIRLDDLVFICRRNWVKHVIEALFGSIFSSIDAAETRFDKFKLYAKDLAYVEKIQGGDSSMNLENAPNPQPSPVVPEGPVRHPINRKVKT